MALRFLIAAFALLLMAGCGDPAAPLLGKWQAELVPPPNESATLAERLAYAVSKDAFSLEFTHEQRISFRAGEKEIAGGSWKYLRREGEEMVLEIQLDNNAKQSTEERITWVDAERISWQPPGVPDKSLTFKRIQPKTN